MTDLDRLISALRAELLEYGEMLARLEEQQEHVIRGSASELMQSLPRIQEQAEALAQRRDQRLEATTSLGKALKVSNPTDPSEWESRAPGDYGPLLKALIKENSALLERVQTRARENEELLARSLDSMQQLLQVLVDKHNTKAT